MRKPLSAIQEFLRLEASGGIVLVAVAALALIVDNSPLASLYDRLLDLPFAVSLGSFGLSKPLILWINDGLMAIFFLLVGLEIKREVLDGELSSLGQIALPAVAAICGMAAPAAIYVALNLGDATALRGWAVPAATDIAFALGVLALLGSRVPASLKILLMAIAVLDDLGAIVVIAIFYTEQLSLTALALAAVGIVALIALNRLGVRRLAPYLLVGVFLWVCVLKSGVHATLAGVAVGFAIPARDDGHGHSPLKQLEHALHPWVAYAILPIFAFANAGVSLAGISLNSFAAPVSLGIAAGLFVGKQFGIFLGMLAMVKLKLARMPADSSWPMLYAVAILCGIGFTMSLFIGGLAFDESYAAQLRLGVLTGSILSALAGYLLMKVSVRRRA
ncbi:MAG: Na+/H+ antiporter NhaA [Rhodospirillales bacterium]